MMDGILGPAGGAPKAGSLDDLRVRAAQMRAQERAYLDQANASAGAVQAIEALIVDMETAVLVVAPPTSMAEVRKRNAPRTAKRGA